jgi:hypothetical protein
VLLRATSVYEMENAATTPQFVLNPALAQHVLDMVARRVIQIPADVIFLERFADWLAAWPADRKEMLRPAIRALEINCPIPKQWERVFQSNMF